MNSPDLLSNQIKDGRTDLIFEYLTLPKGADSDIDGVPIIKWAAYYGDVSAIKYLLSQGARLDQLGPNLDLHGAAFHGHWQLVQYLLENGADPNLPLSTTGETPLHSALCKANSPSADYIVKLLLWNGAYPNVQTAPHAETDAFMRDVKTKGETPLHRAAAFGNDTIIQLLIDAGADLTATDIDGETPIAWASWHLRPGIILSLLQHGTQRISHAHIEKLRSDHGFGPGGGIMAGLKGQVHLSE